MYFWRNQSQIEKDGYEANIKFAIQITQPLIGSAKDNPNAVMDSKCAENILCFSFGATNIAQKDNTADAHKDGLGIAIKTMLERSVNHKQLEKIAEFDKERDKINKCITDIDKAKQIARFRNQRIRDTKKECNLNEITYHLIVRNKDIIKICECTLEEIDINNISLQKARKGNVRFTDGKHIYNFLTSKSTLTMQFDTSVAETQFKADLSLRLNDFIILRQPIQDAIAHNAKKSEICKLCEYVENTTKIIETQVNKEPK